MKEQNTEYSILFIEDNPVTLKNYTLMLKDYFDKVYTAENGSEGYIVYQDKKPDILLVDVDMPKLNGIDLLKKIRKNDQHTKAILFTAFSDQETLLNASTLKLTQYLIKPIKRKDLLVAIEAAIEELKSFDVITKKSVLLKEQFIWDINKEKLFKNNKKITLTNKEKEVFSLLIKLSRNKEIITYENIIYTLWDEYNESSLKSLKTIIYSLRKKLPEDTIENEYSIGYKLKTNE